MVRKFSIAISLALGTVLVSSLVSPGFAKPGNGNGNSGGSPKTETLTDTCTQNSGDREVPDPIYNSLGVLANFCVGPILNANDSGAQTNVLTYLNGASPGNWESYVKYDVDESKYSYAESGIENIMVFPDGSGGTSGTFTFDFAKLFEVDKDVTDIAISIKGSQDYVLYGYEDIANSFSGQVTWNWSTSDLTNNGGNTPGLSHLKVFVKRLPKEKPEAVPEPMSVLGLVVFGGTVATLKRKRS